MISCSPPPTVIPPDLDLALRFLSTQGGDGSGIDRLATPSSLSEWLEGEGLAPSCSGSRSPAEIRLLLTEAHRLRDAVALLVEAFVDGAPLPGPALFALNRALAPHRAAVALEPAPGRPRLTQRHAGEGPLAALAPVALAAARLLAEADPGRVRRCASAACGTWFVDSSKGGRRKWCSMARCGNREKAARHRRRAATG